MEMADARLGILGARLRIGAEKGQHPTIVLISAGVEQFAAAGVSRPLIRSLRTALVPEI
jgi:hypothetical protein